MGSANKDLKRQETEEAEPKRILKTYLACLWSFLVSITGGLLLGWWEYEFHPTNSQQWMVPFGLILFATPVIVWFSVLVSDICNNSSEGAQEWNPQPGNLPDDNVHDLER